MGISLLSCCNSDPVEACRKIYDKICRHAERLVSTGEQIEHGHGHTRVLEGRGKLMEGNARHRHVGTEAVERENSQGEEDLLAQLRNLECVND